MLNALNLFVYARRYADRCEARGDGTQFPTVRMAAKRFGVPQETITQCVEDSNAAEVDADYFALAVGVQIQGVGHAMHESIGDYQLECYRKDNASKP